MTCSTCLSPRASIWSALKSVFGPYHTPAEWSHLNPSAFTCFAVAHGLDQLVPPSCTDRIPLLGSGKLDLQTINKLAREHGDKI